MADTAAQVAEVVALLRERGYDVREVPGWQDRGRGSMTTRGRIEHHTAGGSGNAPSLRVVTRGRRGLRNSLSRWFVARDETIYLVARRKSWHAGRGSKGTNGTLSGTEAEHSGDPAEPWLSLDAQAAISAAECEVFGVDPGDVWDHREHARPRGRKPDRVNVDSHRWRKRVRRLLDADRPEPDDEPLEADEMIHLWKGTSPGGTHGYWLVQFRLDAPHHRGYYSPVQPDELKQWQHRAESGRVPDVVDATKYEASPGWFDRLDPADG